MREFKGAVHKGYMFFFQSPELSFRKHLVWYDFQVVHIKTMGCFLTLVVIYCR